MLLLLIRKTQMLVIAFTRLYSLMLKYYSIIYTCIETDLLIFIYYEMLLAYVQNASTYSNCNCM